MLCNGLIFSKLVMSGAIVVIALRKIECSYVRRDNLPQPTPSCLNLPCLKKGFS